MKLLLGIFAIIEIIVNIIFVVHLDIGIDDSTPHKALKKWFEKLFHNRNIFGKILSSLIVILFIPGIIIGYLMELIIIIGAVCLIIWDLGKKRDEK